MWAKSISLPPYIIDTEQNGVNESRDEILCSSSTDVYIYVRGQEFYASDFEWVAYTVDIAATELYGNAWTGSPSAKITCVRSVTGTQKDLGGGRTLDRIECLWYPSISGESLHRKTFVSILKAGEEAEAVNSIVFGTFAGVSNTLREREEMDYTALERFSCGWDYDTISDLVADWTFDTGILADLTKTGPYPNYLPDFNSPDWEVTGGATRDTSVQYTLDPGTILRCWVTEPLPPERLCALVGELTAGSASVSMGYNRDANSIETLAASSVTTGGFSLQATTSATDHCLFIDIQAGPGGCTVRNLCWQPKPDAAYVAYDGSTHGPSGWWNGLRVQGSNLSGKRFVRHFGEHIDVSLTNAVGLWLRPHNSSDPEHAFRFIYVLPDGSERYSPPLDIWIDWNERYYNQASKFNYWDDGWYVEFIPDGVTAIEGIGIELLTDEPIDWHLEDLFFFTHRSRTLGPGSYQATRLGLQAGHARQEDRALGPYIAGSAKYSATVTDLITIVWIEQDSGGYADRSKLSFKNLVQPIIGEEEVVVGYEEDGTPITELQPIYGEPNATIYELALQSIDVRLSAMDDHGDVAYCTLPPDAYIVESAEHVASGESYRILGFDASVARLEVAKRTIIDSDFVKVRYYVKSIVDPADYAIEEHTTDEGELIWTVHWEDNAWVKSRDRSTFRVEYTVEERADTKIGMSLIGDRQVRDVVRDFRSPDSQSPSVAMFYRLFLSENNNSEGSCLTTYHPLIGSAVDSPGAELESVYHETNGLSSNTRREPLNPTPRNYGTVPHISFGGEFVAEDPMYTADTVATKLSEGDLSNVIIGGGSLSAAKTRLRGYWWGWANAVLDNGVSYGDVMRGVVRKGYDEDTITNNINQHRYLVEVTLFNYKWLCKHRDQIAWSTDGTLKFKRVWYFETADGSDYYVVQHGVDDFQPEYYDPIDANNKTYFFKYHYVMNYPSYWTVITRGSDWGGEVTTIFDLWMALAEEYASQFDCDGVIFSEFINSYGYANSPNDLQLYNDYRAAHGLPTLTDFVRTSGGLVSIDNAEFWDWKVWQTNRAMEIAASMVHSYGKLLGMSGEIEPIISVQDKDAPVWDGYTKDYRVYGFGSDDPTAHWHVRELHQSCRRYGQDYAELTKENRVDFFYMWLYYRYCPEDWWKIEPDVVDDFIAFYKDYRERMLVGIGLYPRSNPPDTADEVKFFIDKLAAAGYQVAYPGWPRLVTVEKYQEMWRWLKDYTPMCTWTGDEVLVNPKQFGGMPFLSRF